MATAMNALESETSFPLALPVRSSWGLDSYNARAADQAPTTSEELSDLLERFGVDMYKNADSLSRNVDSH